MPKPIVLVTPGSWAGQIACLLEELGAHVILRNGLSKLESDYRYATHLLLTGGADIHPNYYNQRVTHARPVEPERDAAEILLADAALIDRKPIMGICRGHQMIAVAAGGTLYQDIHADFSVKHEDNHHFVRARKGTRLNAILKSSVGLVNSYHHQAVAYVPRGWYVAAHAPDGVIESIEHPTLPALSVQWHPEALPDVESESLFWAFLRMRPPAALIRQLARVTRHKPKRQARKAKRR